MVGFRDGSPLFCPRAPTPWIAGPGPGPDERKRTGPLPRTRDHSPRRANRRRRMRPGQGRTAWHNTRQRAVSARAWLRGRTMPTPLPQTSRSKDGSVAKADPVTAPAGTDMRKPAEYRPVEVPSSPTTADSAAGGARTRRSDRMPEVPYGHSGRPAATLCMSNMFPKPELGR